MPLSILMSAAVPGYLHGFNRRYEAEKLVPRYSAILWLLFAPSAFAQPATTAPASAPAASVSTRPTTSEPKSEAERIAGLRRSIAESERLVSELKTELDDPKSESHQAEAAFAEIDAKLTRRKKDLAKAQESGGPEVAKLQDEVDGLERGRRLTKERFDLAIQERKTLQEQIVTAEKKLSQDRDALDRLLSPPQTATQPAAAKPIASEPTAKAEDHPGSPKTGGADKARTVTTARPADAVGPPLPGPAAAEDGAGKDLIKLIDKPKPPSKELVAAQQEAQTKQLAAQKAEHEARSIDDRMAALRKSIELERKLLDTSRKKTDNAAETVRSLGALLQKKTAARAPLEETQEVWRKINQAQQRLNENRSDAQSRSDRLDKLQDELSSLQAEQIAALREAEARRSEAESAQKRVVELQNPFAPRNLLRWLLDSGVKVAGILIGMLLLIWVSARLKKRMISLVAIGPGTGTEEERQNRATTLVSVFQNAASLLIVVGGALMILTELGVNILPLMGTAAVAGLAIAFGAQNLIRDYFTGFMILLENQYGINDVIRVGAVSGQVERITLRITVLRDVEGVVHFVPNGQIATVSNLTHVWSRARFDITVSYKENVDHVMKVLLDLGKELRRDPEYRYLIVEDPEMSGVEALGDNGVVIRFLIKTRPQKQWPVKREMLRRIKNRFDELGIEIPMPQRALHITSDSTGIPKEPGISDARDELDKRFV